MSSPADVPDSAPDVPPVPPAPDLAPVLLPAAATGVGSMPGSSPREALRIVLGELAELAYLPELPARGAGADLVGRGVALLADLHGDVQPSGWRFVPGPGRDERRAISWLAEDLDVLEELATGWSEQLKLQVAGPVTLASSVELPRGGLAARDPGARRDIAGSLAEGVVAHVADVRRRLPTARLVLQLDEPLLPTALAGHLPTASGFGALPALEAWEAEEALRAVIAAAKVPVVVHCCAPSVPVGLLRRAGALGVSLDATLLAERDDEVLGEAVDAGTRLLLGTVPALPPAANQGLSVVPSSVSLVRRLWHRLGFAPAALPDVVTVTPTCGLAGATPAWAVRALGDAREAARRLADDPEESARG